MTQPTFQDNMYSWYNFGLDLSTATIYLGSVGFDEEERGVDYKMAEHLIKSVTMLDSVFDETPDLHIVMNNPGGDFYHGMAIYDCIKSWEAQVTMEVYGCAMSMGSVILQAADIRVMHPNSTMMIHYGEAGMVGHAKDFDRVAAEYDRLNKWLENLYLEKMREVNEKITLRKVKDILKFDTYLTAEDSVKLGLADLIANYNTGDSDG